MITLAELDAERLRRSLYDFVVDAWVYVEPGTVFVDGWHIRAICQYLQELSEGHIPSNNLLINVPPRHMKSLIVNIFFIQKMGIDFFVANRISFTTFLDISSRFKGKEKPQNRSSEVCNLFEL